MMRIYLEIGRSMGIYCISTRGASSAHGAANGGSYHGDDLSIPSNVSPEASWVAEKLRSKRSISLRFSRKNFCDAVDHVWFRRHQPHFLEGLCGLNIILFVGVHTHANITHACPNPPCFMNFALTLMRSIGCIWYGWNCGSSSRAQRPHSQTCLIRSMRIDQW